MKLLKIYLLLLLTFSLQLSTTSAGFFDELKAKIPYQYDCEGDDCLKEGIKAAKGIGALETEKKASEYIQDVVTFLITFLTLIAVIYIIYAGFNILTGAGDEDKTKKSKSIIIYVIVGITLIWLAFPITKFIFQLLNGTDGI